MDRPKKKPRTLTLKEVLEGAERAERRVSAWPQWKRDFSAFPLSEDEPHASQVRDAATPKRG